MIMVTSQPSWPLTSCLSIYPCWLLRMDKVSSLRADITTRLTSISDTPALDASVLLAHVINKPRTWVIAHPELTLTYSQQKQLDDALEQLQAGEPLPYVLGHWEFFSLDFDITSDVLIPRPETELLVEKAISWLRQFPKSTPTIADVGTGSGVIAVSIAVHVPDARILATDLSQTALHIARSNAKKFNVTNQITFIECDLLPEKSSIDLICANLPYIPIAELHSLRVYYREPTLALNGGEDGLDQIRKLLTIAPGCLAKDGLLLLEIEATQGAKALALARGIFPNASIDLHKDLAGKDRLLSVNLSTIDI